MVLRKNKSSIYAISTNNKEAAFAEYALFVKYTKDTKNNNT